MVMAAFLGGWVGGGCKHTRQGATAMAYAPAQTWVAWNAMYVTGTTTNVQCWDSWNQLYSQQTAMATNQVMATPQPSQAQLDEWKVLAEKSRKAAEEARVRAETLLVEHLDPHQRESYQKDKLFIVETPKKNRYKLSMNHAPRKLEGTKEVVSYCIHTYGVPREDELLGFKLLLEANEDQFLKTANATRLAA
jgi:hypothetical protein